MTGNQFESPYTKPRVVMEPCLPKPFGTQPYLSSSFNCPKSPLPGFNCKPFATQPYQSSSFNYHKPPPPGFSWRAYASDTSTRPPFNFPDRAFPRFSPPGRYPDSTATAPKIKQTLRWTASDSGLAQRKAHSNPVAGTEQQQQNRGVSERAGIHQLALYQKDLEKLRDINLKRLVAMRETQMLAERGLPPTLDSPQQQDVENFANPYEGGGHNDYSDIYSGLDSLDDVYGGYGLDL